MMPGPDKPRIGISTCLLGENVRYDGDHARDGFLTDTFGRFVEWVPVCPEAETGLGVPREPIHLVGDPESSRLVTVKTGVDVTAGMKRWAKRRLKELEGENLVGYVFKSRSPSCGIERVKVFDGREAPRRVGTGIWARAFMDRFPLLPVEDEEKLRDPRIRENFIECVFCLRRYRDAMRPRRSRGALVRFHAEHEFQIMAHSLSLQKEMGRLLASARERNLAELCVEYEAVLVRALRLPATARKNADVLRHALGHLRRMLTADEKREMLDVISECRRGFLPLIVPVTMLAHHARRHDEPHLASQTYLSPDPVELRLRNHA